MTEHDCRVYWGQSGCGPPRGHDSGQDIRVHRQLEPDQKVTAETAFLFGEDLNEAERALIAERW